MSLVLAEGDQLLTASLLRTVFKYKQPDIADFLPILAADEGEKSPRAVSLYATWTDVRVRWKLEGDVSQYRAVLRVKGKTSGDVEGWAGHPVRG